MRIWIDADACPKVIKEFIFSAAIRLNTEVILVANSQLSLPHHRLFSLVRVGKNLDEADRYILQNCKYPDLVITADIPLASALVDKGVIAINPRGEVYTEESVKDALAMRNLFHDLRIEGAISGGPKNFNEKDKRTFINSFDRIVTKIKKEVIS